MMVPCFQSPPHSLVHIPSRYHQDKCNVDDGHHDDNDGDDDGYDDHRHRHTHLFTSHHLITKVNVMLMIVMMIMMTMLVMMMKLKVAKFGILMLLLKLIPSFNANGDSFDSF